MDMFYEILTLQCYWLLLQCFIDTGLAFLEAISNFWIRFIKFGLFALT